MEAIRSSMKWCLLFSLSCTLYASINYETVFLGLEEPSVQLAIEQSTQLVLQKKRLPPSIRALHYRVSSDIPKIVRVLQAYGYYDARVYWDIENETNPVLVRIIIYPGFRYTIGKFHITHTDNQENVPIALEKIGLKEGRFVDAKTVLDAPGKLLRFLANHHHPLACIKKTQYRIEKKNKTLIGKIRVKNGPKVRFGPLLIKGLKTVKPEFVLRKLRFEEGEWYNENLVQESERNLIDTGLFGSVLFSHEDSLDENKQLPIKLEIAEAKHKNISLGLFYATLDGPGASVEWIHRNVFGQGHTVAFVLDASKIYSVGILSYTVPDFLRMEQTYFTKAELARELITVYEAKTYEGLQQLERPLGNHFFGSLGIGYEYITIKKSIANGSFSFLSLPMSLSYKNTDSLLNPTKGFFGLYTLYPYYNLHKQAESFLEQKLTLSTYVPITPKGIIVFATRLQFGSIIGARLENIPFNKRFLAGSDENLRGYRYKTVSPLNSNDDPTGGRSAIYGNFELRFRLTDNVGLVPFFDIGKVDLNTTPQLHGKWLKSAGLGLRYFLFFGPLRLDVAAPLNRIRKEDKIRPRMYISIGQTF